MMQSDGELTAIGQSSKLLEVIGKYGDAAMDFVWKNKGPLTVAAALAAFLNNPQPFIDGAVDITKIAAENVAKPIASVPGQVAGVAARNTNWTIVLSVMLIVVGGLAWLWWRRNGVDLLHGHSRH